MSQCELIYQAYERMMEQMNNDKQRFELADQTLNKFHSAIHSWNGVDDNIDFYKDFLTGKEPNSVASEGGARVTQPNFIEFMDREEVRDKVRKLFLLRKTEEIDYHLMEKVKQVGLYDSLRGLRFERGGRPWFYVGRFLIMVFPEISTTIALRKCLDKVARDLGVVAKSYEEKHKQVMQIVERCLRHKGVYEGLSIFQRAAVAWFLWEIIEKRNV